MAYSKHFRKKVLKYRRDKDATIEETAKYFHIGTASIVRWVHKPEPQKTRYRKPTKIPDDVLRKDVEQYPDSYQYERAQRLGVSESGIFNALKRLKITYKKNTSSSKGRPTKT